MNFLDKLLEREFPNENFEKTSTCVSQQKINELRQVIKRAKLKQIIDNDKRIFDRYECASININLENVCISDIKLFSILLLAKTPYQAFLTLIKNITLEDCYISVIHLSYGIQNDVNELTNYLLNNVILPKFRTEKDYDELISAAITIEEFSKYSCDDEKEFIQLRTYKKYQRIIYCIYFSIACRDKKTFTSTLMNRTLRSNNYWMINSYMIDDFIKEQNGNKLIPLIEEYNQLLTIKQIDKCMAKILLLKNSKKSLFNKLEPILSPYKDNENVPHIDKFFSILLMQDLAEEDFEFED